MDGIVIGCSPTSNAIVVYNPHNHCYYEPDSYKIDPYQLPSLVYPTIIYAGGLFVSLHCGDVPSIREPYPPGTRIEEVSPSNNAILCSGTVMTFPWTQQFPHSTSSNLTMALQNRFLPPKCPPSYPNLLRRPPTCPTYYFLSYVSTLRSHSNTKDSSIKVTSPNLQRAPSASAISHTSTRNTPIGVFLYPTSHLLGPKYALTGFYCPVTPLAALFGTHHLPTLSTQPTFFEIALDPYSRP
jgi:hypothetical protein